MTKKRDAEDRRQQQLRRLQTETPLCVVCREADPRVLELHHVAGQKHSDDMTIVCRNRHRKLSDQQRDHVPPDAGKPVGLLSLIGHYLSGLANLFAMMAEALRKFGRQLIELAVQASTT